MRTQGISLMTGKSSGQMSPKTTKAKDATFDLFISNHASGVGNPASGTDRAGTAAVKNAKTAEKPAAAVSERPADSVPAVSERQDNRLDLRKEPAVKTGETVSCPDKNAPIQEEWTEESMAAAAEAVMQYLQVSLGLPAEDIEIILDQMGIAVEDFVQVNSGNMELMQDFVMQFHGITDRAEFLTNDALGTEVAMLAEQVARLVNEVSEKDVAQENIPVMSELSEEAAPDLNLSGETVETEDPSDGGIDKLPVIVEDQTQTGADSGQERGFDGNGNTPAKADLPMRGRGLSAETGVPQSAGAQFAERLAQAFGETRGESVSSADQTMFRIVEQVVSQVRVRVMSGTTSMELQLHPASLGKVALQVTATAVGTATATLTVENQAAKAALESQMITLKETFEQQGLKVDAVEVTVSEFGLDHQGRQAGDNQQNPSGKKKRFRFQEEEAVEKSAEAGRNETEMVRRDQNSMVDYTA